MPKGVYPRKGNPELAALEIDPFAALDAKIYALASRLAAAERRIVEMNESFELGYFPPKAIPSV